MHVHCKSILIADRETTATQGYREGAVIRKEYTTRTTYLMDSVQEHDFEVPDELLQKSTSSRFWSRGPGCPGFIVGFLGRGVLVFLLAGAIWFAARSFTPDMSFVPFAAGAFVVLVLWLIKLLRYEYFLARGSAKLNLIDDAIRKARNWPDDARFELVSIAEWDSFVKRLQGNS
jgi:hypothetical protein